jgi:uridine kinase
MNTTPLIVGIAGGSGSGKTYLAREIAADLGETKAVVLSMDQYFLSDVGDVAEMGHVNFDHPSHLDFRALISHVRQLRAGRSVWAPEYDFKTMVQTPRSIKVEPRPVILVEGLFILAEPMVSLCDLTLFLDVAADERLLGRILRDIRERSAEIEHVIDRYQRFVRPSYRIFVEPTKQNADVVVDFTFRRALFTQALVRLIHTYVDDHQTPDVFAAALRSESYETSFHPEEGFMSMTTDIFKLAKAYPEHSEIRNQTHALTSPAAASLGRRRPRR